MYFSAVRNLDTYSKIAKVRERTKERNTYIIKNRGREHTSLQFLGTSEGAIQTVFLAVIQLFKSIVCCTWLQKNSYPFLLNML